VFVLLPSPISKFQHALLPPKCCELGSMPRLLALPLFSLQTHLWVYQGTWECVRWNNYTCFWCRLIQNFQIIQGFEDSTNFVRVWHDYSMHEDVTLFHWWLYLSHMYLFTKKLKFHNPNDIDLKKNDSNMNLRRVIIEIIFKSLKKQKRILNFLNSSVIVLL
jgi:hypothetical protein